ncbi:hypothetical protein TNCV_3189591 [Trichonephila clavipes]|nr:hypothetical protein TNCV_3189591 [Trichonephila clavipes]
MKGCVDLAQSWNRARICGVEARYTTTQPLSLTNLLTDHKFGGKLLNDISHEKMNKKILIMKSVALIIVHDKTSNNQWIGTVFPLLDARAGSSSFATPLSRAKI